MNMLVLAVICIIAVIAALVIFFVGRAMGPPVIQNKFDEIPADIISMDISGGAPVEISGADIALIEKLGESIRSERKT